MAMVSKPSMARARMRQRSTERGRVQGDKGMRRNKRRGEAWNAWTDSGKGGAAVFAENEDGFTWTLNTSFLFSK